MTDRREVACSIVARQIIAAAADPEVLVPPEWDNYPEIGQYDWEEVLNQIRREVRFMTPSPRAFRDAYAYLEQRTIDTEEGTS